MRIFFECNPIHDLRLWLRVIPAANIITRACLAPCFLDGLDSMFGRGNSKEER